jgi:hypothetical protein
MSEEIALAIADENNRQRQSERELLLADNAALLEIALRAGQVQTYEQAMADAAALKAEHPGAALLAERDALLAVLRLARAGFGTEEDITRGFAFDPVALTGAIRRYDDLIKTRAE